MNFKRPHYYEHGRRSRGNAKGPFIFAGKCGWPGSLLAEADRDAGDQPLGLIWHLDPRPVVSFLIYFLVYTVPTNDRLQR